MKNLSHKSGLRMRDDVQTSQLKCLDMEAKIARQAQQQQQLEEQVTLRSIERQMVVHTE